MGEPTWQEITAEAIRRKAQALKDGRGDIELEGLIVEITREGWKPPAVDPDVLIAQKAVQHWREVPAPQPWPPYTHLATIAARMAREREQERADHPVAFAVRVMAGVFKDLDHAKREARAALDKHRGEA
ncbi:MAG: hypothetical protein IM667_01055 [Phenylobacterium sp.]|uniref:hypothetical protein n=1 Tax=Phenylobacterium sp. TaxID=1871053 RepID=UPI0025F1DECF|nr:hypothetical protein [Phenylobacterium sp.]MCA3711347.1 hypothetical protein [Phenylobacterium sp.]MCA6239200.1 hypothetical protein [Phenylobacterium sp.]